MTKIVPLACDNFSTPDYRCVENKIVEPCSCSREFRADGRNSTKVRIDMPKKSKRLQAKKEPRKPPPPAANAQNSSDTADPATQHFLQEDLEDVSVLLLPTCLDPNNDGHHAAIPAGEHGAEQRNEIVGLSLACLRNLAVAAARSTDEHFLHPPPQPDHEYHQHHQETPGSGNASTQQPAGLKTTGLESEAGHDVDDDRSLLQDVSRVGSFDDLDVHDSIPPPPPQPPTPTPPSLDKFPAWVGGSAAVMKAPPLLLAPRPLPAGNVGITNCRGAVQMLPKTTGKGTGKKRGPYKENIHIRESCTSTNPSQSSTISIKLNQPLQQFQQRSVFVSHPDPISEKFSATEGSYTNMKREDRSSDDDSSEERVIWPTKPYASEDEKEVSAVFVLAL